LGVANHVEKLQWISCGGGIGKEFKFHLVGWNKVCSPISKGVWGSEIYSCLIELSWGSGYGNMLLRERLYGVVMDSKYGNMWGGWSSNEVNGSHGVGL
jgi:hypothetical protein